LLVSTGMHGATCNLYTGLHDFAEMAFTVHLLRPGDLFGDVGANVGVYTVLAGAVAGARCIAYEPSPEAARHLAANVAVNRINCEIVKAAVGSAAGVVQFTSNRGPMNRIALDGEDGAEVSVVTLDETCAGATMLKIDVEGFEIDVLAGAEAVLKDPALLAVIMETNEAGVNYGSSNGAVLSAIAAYGFESYSYDPFNRTLSPGAPDRNAILVRDPAQVAERLRSSRAFKVLGRTL